MVVSSIAGAKKLQCGNRSNETLMNKGFQRTIKKIKQNKKSLNCFVFVNALKQ